jgi:hypothetical protein
VKEAKRGSVMASWEAVAAVEPFGFFCLTIVVGLGFGELWT